MPSQVAPETGYGALEITSGLGRKLYALPDDQTVISARKALAADSKSVALVLALSKAQAARRQYKEAVATATQGLVFAPKNADLYLERGHRQMGLREFKAAMADLERATQFAPEMLDAHYHLGLAHYFSREFDEAAASFERARALAKTNDSLIDCSNWLYVSLRRAGKEQEAAQVLSRITPGVKNTEPHLVFLSPSSALLSGAAYRAGCLAASANWTGRPRRNRQKPPPESEVPAIAFVLRRG